MGVRVRLPPAAPARRKRHIACDELFHFITKRIARSFCCSSLPTATRFRWARGWDRPAGGFFRKPEISILTSRSKKRHAMGACLSFWVPLPLVAPPVLIPMLGRNEFALRQGFGLRPKRLYGANAPRPGRAALPQTKISILTSCTKKKDIC